MKEKMHACTFLWTDVAPALFAKVRFGLAIYRIDLTVKGNALRTPNVTKHYLLATRSYDLVAMTSPCHRKHPELAKMSTTAESLAMGIVRSHASGVGVIA
jgi:hypothetical protein